MGLLLISSFVSQLSFSQMKGCKSISFSRRRRYRYFDGLGKMEIVKDPILALFS